MGKSPQKVARSKVRLGAHGAGGIPEEVEIANVMPGFPTIFDDKWRWKAAVEGRWKHPQEHINIKGARIAVAGLRRFCWVAANHNSRAFSLCDNLVSCCAFDMGRARSWALNLQCRRMCAYRVGCCVRWRVRHVPTDDNVAEEGSRRFEPPDPWSKEQGIRLLPGRPPPEGFEPPPGLPPPGAGSQPTHAGDRGDRGVPIWKGAGRRVLETLRESGERIEAETKVETAGLEAGGNIMDTSGKWWQHPRESGHIFLELFAEGKRAYESRLARGTSSGPPFEIPSGPTFDLSRGGTQSAILQLIRTGRAWAVHLGTACSVWSIARKGVKNIPKAKAKGRLGVEFALFTTALVRECQRCRVKWSIGNPRISLLWSFPRSEL